MHADVALSPFFSLSLSLSLCETGGWVCFVALAAGCIPCIRVRAEVVVDVFANSILIPPSRFIRQYEPARRAPVLEGSYGRLANPLRP